MLAVHEEIRVKREDGVIIEDLSHPDYASIGE